MQGVLTNLKAIPKTFLKSGFKSYKYTKAFKSTKTIQIHNTKYNSFLRLSNKSFATSKSLTPSPHINLSTDPMASDISNEVTALIENTLASLDKKSQVNLDNLIKLASKMDRLQNPEQRKEAEDFLLEIFRAENFKSIYFTYLDNQIPHKNFADLFFEFSRIKSLTFSDMAKLQEIYFVLDKLPREFTVQERITIFGAFYYYKRNFGEQAFNDEALGKIYKTITKSFLEFFTSFVHSELQAIIQSIVFLPDEEIRIFANRMVDKMVYILNPEYVLNLNLEKKCDILQYYPRILYTIKEHNEVFQKENEKIVTFLKSNLKEITQFVAPELVLCLLSNYLNWVEHSEDILEDFIPFLYRNLAGFRTDMTLEIFFLILNSNFEKFKNKEKAEKLLNMIFQIKKKDVTSRVEVFDQVKEAFYFNQTREKLESAWSQWIAKHQNKMQDKNDDDSYYLKFFSHFVKMSIDMYPFAAIEYSQETFDRLFSNLKLCIKF